MRGDWDAGRRTPAEAYLDRLDPADPFAAIELVYAEFCLAEEHGLAPDPRSYLARFPAHRDRLARLFGLHDALGPAGLEAAPGPAAPDLPGPGDAIGPYRLLRELGRGGFARVFLAEQDDLEGRLVVLKVSARPSPEPRLLARAGHPHIVAVLRHGEADGGALHLTCMPFQGGADLGAVLAALRRPGRRRRRSGADLLEALDHAAAPESPRPAGEALARDLLGGLRLDAAVAWIVARLAQALDHAHHRGVSHGDLKPSNILLAADGRPMLLDFNLACDWRGDPAARGGSDPGGTLVYMAPERLRALAGAAAAPFPDARARHRADLYALGLILAEALGAPPPIATPDPGGSVLDSALALATCRERPDGALRALFRAVPVGLRPILARCLAPDPADRYPRAAELAEDLDRYRMGLSPRHAPPDGRLATLHARAVRARRAALVVAIAAAVALPVGLLAARARAERRTARAVARYDAFLDAPGAEPLRIRHFDAETVLEDRESVATYLARLRRYGVPGSSAWLDRDDLAWLPDAERVDLRLTMAEQAWCLARSVRRAKALRRDAPAAWAEQARWALAALRHVGGGDTLPAPLHPLAAGLARDLGDRSGLPAGPAPAWLDDYLAGLEGMSDRPRAAVGHFTRCLAAQPGSLRARYARAAAHNFAGDRTAAIADLRACTRLRPRNAAVRIVHAGLLLLRLEPGDVEEAMHQLEVAEAIAGPSPEARWNYPQMHLLLRQLRPAHEASAQFLALQDGATGRAAARLRPVRDDGDERRLDDFLAALEDRSQALAFQGYSLYELGRFEESLRAFEDAARLAPDDDRIAYARLLAMRALHRDADSAAALRDLLARPGFPAFVATFPDASRAYRMRALEQQKAREFDAALATLARGLEALGAGPESGPSRAGLHYAAARVGMVRGLRSDPQVAAVRDHLERARAAAPALVDGWFAADRIYDPVRGRLGYPGSD
jgi:serine/threonine protein kinase